MILVLGGNDNMESILNSTKSFIGISEEETHFDTDIIITINSMFARLRQMGLGPEEPFTIVDDKSVWNEFTEDDPDLSEVKTYVQIKTKLIFDPPANSNILTALKEETKEIEWRLTVVASNKRMEGDNKNE